MSSPRVVVSLLACGLALAACSNNTSKPAAKPAETPAAKPAAPPETPAATPPAAATPPVAGGVPPSGDPGTKTDPTFYLPPDSALTKTASGLKYLMLREGSGTPPKANGGFTAHYCGWFTNGERFDSSYSDGEPLTYPVNRMILGWQEALVLMKPGAEYILVVPPDLGYGAGGNGIPPDSTLVFRMELLSASG